MIREYVQCVIVDDEVLARNLLEQYIQRIPYLKCIGSFESPLEALTLIENNEVDILFLDIQMPEITGIDFLKSIEQKTCTVITSAYPEYALEGYQLNVNDYIVKPISFPRFIQAANKIKELITIKRKASAYDDNSFDQIKHNHINNLDNTDDFITIKSDKKIHRIAFSDILYIEGALEYVSFYLNDNTKILSLNTLRNLEDTLPKNRFLRIHRSYIIALNNIKTIEGNTIEIGKVKLPIGKSYKDALKDYLGF